MKERDPRCVEFRGYMVFSGGRVWRPERSLTRSDGVTRRFKGGWVATRTKRAGKGNGGGYVHIDLYVDQVTETWLLHRLIATCFVPNPENKPDVNHKDGVRGHNNASNLEWVTKSENQTHAVKYVHGHHGANCVSSKLTDAQVEEIRHKRNALGHKLSDLAAEYGVAFQTISAVARGERYAIRA